MNKKLKKLFDEKENIVRGYKKVHPQITNIASANVTAVTSGYKVNIVDTDDNVISVLSYADAMFYMNKANE
jgi:hypothetical protein